jgi:hypothetical protein
MVGAGADVCLAFLLPNSRGSIDCIVRAQIAGIPLIEYHAQTCAMTGERATLCWSACEHPAIEHDNTGCHVYGRLDECSCSGYGSMSRVAWIFGDDPRCILGGGTDSFGVLGGFGVGVAV